MSFQIVRDVRTIENKKQKNTKVAKIETYVAICCRLWRFRVRHFEVLASSLPDPSRSVSRLPPYDPLFFFLIFFFPSYGWPGLA